MVGDIPTFYIWIVVVGGIGALVTSYGIGANDCANAYATSVGAKSITLKQAVILASIFEFLGAFLMGSHVVETIAGGIAKLECFEDDPEILMYGLSCALWSTAMWLILATALEIPVSTTHSTVGGVVGMALAFGGTGCVVWNRTTSSGIGIEGISAIVLSWIISPVLSGLISCALFGSVRFFILRSERSYARALLAYPVLVFVTLAINIFFTIYKGAKGLGLDKTSLGEALAWSLGLSAFLSFGLLPPCLCHWSRQIERRFENQEAQEVQSEMKEGGGDYDEADGPQIAGEIPPCQSPKACSSTRPVTRESSTESASSKRCDNAVFRFLRHQSEKDVHECIMQDLTVGTIHSHAETFTPKTEELFKYVQVFTAICDSFAHGANDVANAMGPFAASLATYRSGGGEVAMKANLSQQMYVILLFGGLGIALGLATWGWRIIRSIGVKLAKITPSRGFCIELSTAMVVVVGSRLGIPLSTTHCQVGATVGVALLEGYSGVNCGLTFKIVMGWIATLILCAATSALLFAQGAYAPCAA